MRLLRALPIVLGIALPYAPALPFPFVFDDNISIVHNETLASPLLALAPPTDTPVSGRPIVNLSFALDHVWSGSHPAGYRLVNLLIHALNGMLVLALLEWVFTREEFPARLRAHARPLALLTALLWVCHPLQSEALVYVTQRTELLAATCLLIVVHAALRAMQSEHGRGFSLLAIVACALGTGCKETLIVAPLLVLLFDRAFFSPSLIAALRAHTMLYAGLVIAELPLVLQVFMHPRGEVGFGLGVSALQSIAVQGAAVLWYLRLSAWPAPLSIVYNWPVADAFPRYIAQDLAIGALLLAALALFRARPRVGLPAFGFFVLLAPTSSFVPVLSEFVAERRMYLPSLCVIVLATTFVYSAFARAASGRIATATWLLSAICAACIWRSAARAQDYRSPIALWGSALAADPDNPLAMWGLGGALDDAGRPREALRQFEGMAGQHYPYVGPSAWGTRGLIAASKLYARLGDARNAALAMQHALDYDPESAVGRLSGAATLARNGDEPAAIAALEAMLRDQPFLHARAHRELATLLMRAGRPSQARAHAREAARLEPNNAQARQLLSGRQFGASATPR